MMYKSPIELIYKDVQNRIEENIFYAIQKVDIKVDRDELIKALTYDRKQYEKGYTDAQTDIQYRIEEKKGFWEWVDDMDYRCSCCHKYAYDCIGEILSGHYKFCPYCGAHMEEKTDE